MATTGPTHDKERVTDAQAGSPTIRDAAAADAAAIARVTIATWRAAYRGIVPERVLDGLSQEAMTALFDRSLGRVTPQGPFYLVVEAPGYGVVGYLGGGPERTGDPAFTGEVLQLYVLPTWQARGLGRRLLGMGARRLEQRGHHSLLIWVYTANEAGRRFYEALGGAYLREREVEIFGARMQETAYGWPDLGVLLGGSGEGDDRAATG